MNTVNFIITITLIILAVIMGHALNGKHHPEKEDVKILNVLSW